MGLSFQLFYKFKVVPKLKKQKCLSHNPIAWKWLLIFCKNEGLSWHSSDKDFAFQCRSSIPGWWANTPHASWPKNQSVKQKKYCKKLNKDFRDGPHTKKKFYKSEIKSYNFGSPGFLLVSILGHYSIGRTMKDTCLFLVMVVLWDPLVT